MLKLTQRERLKKLFEDNPNSWVTLPEILKLGISQYNARIHDLRFKERMSISNKTVFVDGVKHSWYRYNLGHETQRTFA